MLKFHINRLTFKDDTVIRLTPSSLLVVIGPNNSGKSATLVDIVAALENAKRVRQPPQCTD